MNLEKKLQTNVETGKHEAVPSGSEIPPPDDGQNSNNCKDSSTNPTEQVTIGTLYRDITAFEGKISYDVKWGFLIMLGVGIWGLIEQNKHLLPAGYHVGMLSVFLIVAIIQVIAGIGLIIYAVYDKKSSNMFESLAKLFGVPYTPGLADVNKTDNGDDNANRPDINLEMDAVWLLPALEIFILVLSGITTIIRAIASIARDDDESCAETEENGDACTIINNPSTPVYFAILSLGGLILAFPISKKYQQMAHDFKINKISPIFDKITYNAVEKSIRLHLSNWRSSHFGVNPKGKGSKKNYVIFGVLFIVSFIIFFIANIVVRARLFSRGSDDDDDDDNDDEYPNLNGGTVLLLIYFTIVDAFSISVSGLYFTFIIGHFQYASVVMKGFECIVGLKNGNCTVSDIVEWYLLRKYYILCLVSPYTGIFGVFGGTLLGLSIILGVTLISTFFGQYHLATTIIVGTSVIIAFTTTLSLFVYGIQYISNQERHGLILDIMKFQFNFNKAMNSIDHGDADDFGIVDHDDDHDGDDNYNDSNANLLAPNTAISASLSGLNKSNNDKFLRKQMKKRQSSFLSQKQSKAHLIDAGIRDEIISTVKQDILRVRKFTVGGVGVDRNFLLVVRSGGLGLGVTVFGFLFGG